jgi:hypothetical protein
MCSTRGLHTLSIVWYNRDGARNNSLGVPDAGGDECMSAVPALQKSRCTWKVYSLNKLLCNSACDIGVVCNIVFL